VVRPIAKTHHNPTAATKKKKDPPDKVVFPPLRLPPVFQITLMKFIRKLSCPGRRGRGGKRKKVKNK
jgi:hypothetical protein